MLIVSKFPPVRIEPVRGRQVSEMILAILLFNQEDIALPADPSALSPSFLYRFGLDPIQSFSNPGNMSRHANSPVLAILAPDQK
jgi:hypothetical protein